MEVMKWFLKIKNKLFSEVDIGTLAFFRMAFGCFMLYEVYKYIMTGWIWEYFMFRTFYFTYPGFDWVTPLEGNGMVVLFFVMGVMSIFIILGLFYRVSMAIFTLCFTYQFLLDTSNYLNHFYLICLVGFLMIFLPAHRNYSLDAVLRPHILRQKIPAWTLYLLCFQIAVPYVYGGIAKMNSDWLKGEPMRLWLSEIPDFPLIGHLLTEEWMVILLSRAGLALDFFIIGFILYKPTRWLAFAAGVLFHLMNAKLWTIGIFPWFMIVAMTLFFDPSWPRKILDKVFPIKYRATENDQLSDVHTTSKQKKKWILLFMGIYVFVQLAVPFRHHLIPGNTHWTEEAHHFSWHMKLRDKRSDISVFATDNETGKEWEVRVLDFLSVRQANHMSTTPRVMWQFARELNHYYAEKEGLNDVSIRMIVLCSLNNRPRQQIISSDIDLAAIEKYETPAPWILPLETPLIIGQGSGYQQQYTIDSVRVN